MADQSEGASSNWDWTGISDEAARELLRQGEMRLSDMLTVSIAADQRATTLASVCVAISVGLAAASAAVFADLDGAALAGIGITALIELAAAGSFYWTSRPIDFYPRGYEPGILIKSGASESWMIRFVCEDIQLRIEDNKKILDRSAELTTKGLLAATMAPLVGVIVFALVQWC